MSRQQAAFCDACNRAVVVFVQGFSFCGPCFLEHSRGNLQFAASPGAERADEDFGFIRIHRSALVNASLVSEIRRVTRHRLVAVLSDGSEVRLAQEYRRRLEHNLSIH